MAGEILTVYIPIVKLYLCSLLHILNKSDVVDSPLTV